MSILGMSVPIAGNEESREGRVVSIAGSERSGAAEDPTADDDESKEGIPKAVLDREVSGPDLDDSAADCELPAEVVVASDVEGGWLVSWIPAFP